MEWGKRVVERETRWARSEGKEEVMAVTRVSAVLRKESLGREEGGRRVSVFFGSVGQWKKRRKERETQLRSFERDDDGGSRAALEAPRERHLRQRGAQKI